MNDWKKALGVVYSTNPAYEQEADAEEQASLPNNKQMLCISFQKRNGKPATILSGYQGSDQEIKVLAKMLKVKCGVGGSTRDGEILIQGDVRTKLKEILRKEGYKTKGG